MAVELAKTSTDESVVIFLPPFTQSDKIPTVITNEDGRVISRATIHNYGELREEITTSYDGKGNPIGTTVELTMREPGASLRRVIVLHTEGVADELRHSVITTSEDPESTDLQFHTTRIK